MSNEITWSDGIDDESIARVLAEALSKGYTSFWLQISQPEFFGATPIIIGTKNKPKDPDARRYVYLGTETGWVWA